MEKKVVFIDGRFYTKDDNGVYQLIQLPIIGGGGSRGAKGSNGANGANGVQGPQGIGSGSPGAQGNQGVQGANGSNGTNGVQGTQGNQGDIGSQGTQGSQGQDGVQGVQGTQGNDGAQGTQGSQGYQGSSAADAWLLMGNQGTQQGVNFLGTTDNVGIDFRTNNNIVGSIANTGEWGINVASQVGTQFYIQGQGTTSATYSLKIDNATPTSLFYVRDDGYISAGNSIGVMTIGLGSGFNPTLTNNTFVGVKISVGITTSTANTAIGAMAMNLMTTGSSNVAVGNGAGSGGNGSGGVFIGFNAGIFETGNSKLFIDDAPRGGEQDGRNKALIYGKFDALTANQFVVLNGALYMQDTVAPNHYWSGVIVGGLLTFTDTGSANAPG